MAVDASGAGEPSEARRLLDEVLAELVSRGPRIPSATYRLQLGRHLTLDAARGVLGYLDALGISDAYTSPFFKARPDSLHGYDVVDHNAIHPALGGPEALEAFSAELTRRGMGLVLDFVPNHMGVGVRDNVWWMDVLENGPSSLFAPYFDIAWTPLKAELANKVLLPILGDPYGRVLERGELRVSFEAGAFLLHSGETALPLNPRSYRRLLEPLLAPLVEALGAEHEALLELQSIITGLDHLPARSESVRAKVIERRREKEILKRRLATLVADTPEVVQALLAGLSRMNGTPGDARSFDALHGLLEEQAYRLAYWRVAAEEINYRRFFDINDLAAVRVEHPPVFETMHRLLLELAVAGRVTGVRIDHPDGLRDPQAYFAQLQRAYVVEACRVRFLGPAPARERLLAFERLRPELDLLQAERAADPRSPEARPLYVLAEKILSRGEALPDSWPVYGTSGYDFANSVGGLFVDGQREAAMDEVYARFTGTHVDFATLAYRKKRLVLETTLASELAVLSRMLDRLSERDRHSRDFTLGSLTTAVREVLACFPVYRTYLAERSQQPTDAERAAIARAVRDAIRRNPAMEPSIYRFLQSALTLNVPATVAAEDRVPWRQFVLRFQQLTGPVMAKGLEDTAFYVYNRLVSLNEVGGEPERYGVSPAAFHRANEERRRSWPAAMLATSTHDTKRSEDVRARISVLSELPEDWGEALARLGPAAAALKTEVDGRLAPDENEEYLLYQTILGTWPVAPPTPPEREDWVVRLVAYMRKATKEAKVHTSWVNAAPDYDAAVERFVRAVLEAGGPVDLHLSPLAARVAFHGLWNGLSQVLLKLTSPGVPDTYQGTELWDYSLVDPDNRRPVDFARCHALLAELRERMDEGPAFARELVAHAPDGRLKLLVTHAALQARRRHPAAFAPTGTYAPAEARGPKARHAVAFLRQAEGTDLVVVAPRLTVALTEGRSVPPVGEAWADTTLAVRPGRWRHALTQDELSVPADGVLRLDRALRDVPLALLEWLGPGEEP